MVNEVANVIEIKYRLMAVALVYPMVKFILSHDMEGKRKTMLNTKRANSPAEVFCGIIGCRLDGSAVQTKDTDKKISISGFLCLVPHHSKDLRSSP